MLLKPKKDNRSSKENSISFYSKLSKKEKELFRGSSNLIFPEKPILTYDDLIEFERAKEFLLPIKEKYRISLDELFAFVKEQLFLPVTVFNEKLTVLETVVKYLKEEKFLSLSKIADLIGRDQRNVWHIYDKSKEKYSKKFVIKKTDLWIPVSIFLSELSALEAIVCYLHDELYFSFHEIAILLKRDDRTIWTAHSRARKKNVENK